MCGFITKELRLLSPEGIRYSFGGLTADDSAIMSTFDRNSQIWKMDASGDSRTAIQLTRGKYYQTINRLQTSIVADHGRLTQNRVSVRWGKAYKEIIDYVKENAIDLVTMGAHGADCEEQTLFGSNIDRVLRLSPSAVLIAHPRKPSID